MFFNPFHSAASAKVAILYGLMAATPVLGGCGPNASLPTTTSQYIVTIHPLGAIIDPLVQNRGEVTVLVPPGASPHTYDVRPRDARLAAQAGALFYVGPMLDAWAADLATPRRVEVLDLVPSEFRLTFDRVLPGGSADLDPHFWLDPLTVRATLPNLAAALAKADPDKSDAFDQAAKIFAADLESLDAELRRILESAAGESVIEFHPSMGYFLNRYGLRVTGAIESAPGREPTPKDLKRLIDRANADGVRVIITEPQLPREAVRAIAEATGAQVVELDPLGGAPGRSTYGELLLFNAHALAKAFA